MISRNFLWPVLQDKHASENMLGNLDDEETDLHTLLTDLRNDLNLQKRINIGKTLS